MNGIERLRDLVAAGDAVERARLEYLSRPKRERMFVGSDTPYLLAKQDYSAETANARESIALALRIVEAAREYVAVTGIQGPTSISDTALANLESALTEFYGDADANDAE